MTEVREKPYEDHLHAWFFGEIYFRYYQEEGEADLLMNAIQFIVVIPSYQPEGLLIQYVRELKEAGIKRILLVDDGSGEEYRAIFDDCEKESGVTVLRHDTNCGKGKALKTGFTWCLESEDDFLGIVTADSDGQHRTDDILKIIDELAKDQTQLVLGVRDFTGKHVPSKSRFGNLLTIKMFHLLHGKRVSDTQTGLRGIGKELLPTVASLPGQRFEYEMGMLIYAARHNVPILEVPIETIYERNNEGTHFRPIVDSIKIYGLLFTGFLRYLISSLSASILDIGCFTILNLFIFRSASLGVNVYASTILARIISSFYNFLVNRKVVFGASEGNIAKQAIKYYTLAVCQLLCSAGLVYLLTKSLHLNATIVKIVVDTVLFFVSFQIQNRLIFNHR